MKCSKVLKETVSSLSAVSRYFLNFLKEPVKKTHRPAASSSWLYKIGKRFEEL